MCIRDRDIQDAIFKHIAEQMKCSVDELHSGETNFIMDETVSKRYVDVYKRQVTHSMENVIYNECHSFCGRNSGKLFGDGENNDI